MTEQIENQIIHAGHPAAHAPEHYQEPTYDRAALDLLKKTVAAGTNDLEFQLFMRVIHRTGLDPFAKQIYAIKRGSKMSIQTGIDGYRLIAARTGELAGIDDIVYDTEEGAHPNKASVTIYRLVRGVRVPFTASARWSEYAQSYNGDLSDMWKRMPFLMLGKCAEALCLRKAFPQELSGIYTDDEMSQADSYAPDETPPPPRAAAAARTVSAAAPVSTPAPAPRPPAPKASDAPPPGPEHWKSVADADRHVRHAMKFLGFTGQEIGETIKEFVSASMPQDRIEEFRLLLKSIDDGAITPGQPARSAA